MAKPTRLIALEEHFLMPGTPMPAHAADDSGRATEMMRNFDLRIEIMDKFGIDMHVLSHSGPPWRNNVDPVATVKIAREVNDYLAKIIQKYPGRLAAFASVPVQDPKAAADELERAVTQLGLKGTLIHHMGDGDYLDNDRYLPIWERAEALNVPIYLHPAATTPPMAVADGYPGMDSAMWGWTAQTGGHALRILLSGVFDRFPRARLMLGHMGETIPNLLWRIDSRFLRRAPKVKLKKLPSDYMKENVLVTTSGVFANNPLLGAIAELGIDSVMFAVDYPHEEDEDAVKWIANVPLPQADIEKIAHGNAERFLRL